MCVRTTCAVLVCVFLVGVTQADWFRFSGDFPNPIIPVEEGVHYDDLSIVPNDDGVSVAFVRWGNHIGTQLWYGEYDGATWTFTAASDPAYAPAEYRDPVLRLAPDGTPTIAYAYTADYGVEAVRFASWNGASWTHETVVDVDWVASAVAIDFHANGQPAIATCVWYGAYPGPDLVYCARSAPDVWDVTTVRQFVGFDDRHPHFALNSLDEPGFVYGEFSGPDDCLYYTEVFVLPHQEVTCHSGAGASLSLRGTLLYAYDGTPAIAYCNGTLLSYAEYDGAVWSVSELDTHGGSYDAPDHELFASGDPAIGVRNALTWRDRPYWQEVQVTPENYAFQGETAMAVLGSDVPAFLVSWEEWTGAKDFLYYFVAERFPLGDMNCNGTFGFDDVNPFQQYLVDPEEWEQTYPDCNELLGDINGDEVTNYDDINAFVDYLIYGTL